MTSKAQRPVIRGRFRIVRSQHLFALMGAAILASAPGGSAQQLGGTVRQAVQVEQVRQRALLVEPVLAGAVGVPDSIRLVWRPAVKARVLEVLFQNGERVRAGQVIVRLDPTGLERAEELARICKRGTSRVVQAAENLDNQAGVPDVKNSHQSSNSVNVDMSMTSGEKGFFRFGASYSHEWQNGSDSTFSARLEAISRVDAAIHRINYESQGKSCEHVLQDAIDGRAQVDVRATHDGIVHEVKVISGDEIVEGSTLVTLGNEIGVEAVAALKERDYQRAHHGSRCVVEFIAYPGPIPCVLTRKNDKGEGEVGARLLEAPPGVFKGMKGSILIDVRGSEVLALPYDARVTGPNGEDGVWIVQADSTLAFREVTLVYREVTEPPGDSVWKVPDGAWENGRIYVVTAAGIEPGEYVVVGDSTTLAMLTVGVRVDPRPWLSEGAVPDDRQTLHIIATTLHVPKWLDEHNELLPVPLSQLPGIAATNGTVVGIDLRGSDLTGRVPPQISKLKHLRRLDVGNNPRLTGGIPPSLGGLSHLTFLAFDGNTQMAGEVPGSIKALRLDSLTLKSTFLCLPRGDKSFEAWIHSIMKAEASECGPPPVEVGRRVWRKVYRLEAPGRLPGPFQELWSSRGQSIFPGSGWRFVEATVIVRARDNASGPVVMANDAGVRIESLVGNSCTTVGKKHETLPGGSRTPDRTITTTVCSERKLGFLEVEFIVTEEKLQEGEELGHYPIPIRVSWTWTNR